MGRRTLVAGLAAIAALTVVGPSHAATVYGAAWEGTLQLARLDADTMRLTGRRVPLAREPLGWSFSPDRSRLVTGSTARGARLRFVDLRRMRLLGDLTVSRRGSGIATAWVGPRRVLSVVVLPGCCGAGDTVVAVVDAERHRVLWRQRLGGSLQAGERLGRSLLLVLGPRGDAVGPSRLVQVGPHGAARSVALPEIISGTRPSGTVTESWSPGLAVDRSGRRAFVVQAQAPVAEVDLRTFGVESHRMQATPRAADDALRGPQRDALWLGRGKLAITGLDHNAVAAGRSRERPAGLTLVDTRRWVARKIDAQTTDVALASGTLLASSYLYDSRSRRITGSGLSGYSPTGRRKFHLFGRAPVLVQPVGGNALAGGMGATTLIDARSGRRLRSFRRLSLTLMAMDAPVFY